MVITCLILVLALQVSVASGESAQLLNNADQHWIAQRYDLSAQFYVAAREQSSNAEDGDRAGVMAALSLLELGRQVDAIEMLEIVARADTGGYWWGRSLIELGKRGETPADANYSSRRSPGDPIGIETARTRLRAAIEHFSSHADSMHEWRAALVEAHVEHLRRLQTLRRMEMWFELARSAAVTAEDSAAVWSAHVGALVAYEPRASLPDNRRKQSQDRQTRLDQAVAAFIAETRGGEHATAPYRTLNDLLDDPWHGPASAMLETRAPDLLELYPDSKVAASIRANSSLMYKLAPRVELGVGRLPPTTAKDSLLVSVSLRNLTEAEISLRRVSCLDYLGGRQRSGLANRWELRSKLPGHLRSRRDLRYRLPGFMRRLVSPGEILERRTVCGSARGQSDTMVSVPVTRGFYRIEASPNRRCPPMWINVSDLEIITWVDADSLHILASSSSGQPAANAGFQIYHRRPSDPKARRSKYGVYLHSGGMCDPDGYACVGRPRNARTGEWLLLVFRDDDTRLQRLELRGEERRGLVWLDRNAYRPGETGHFAGLLMNLPVHHLTPAAGETVHVEGSSFLYAPLVTDRFGSVNGSFHVSSSAEDGEYSACITDHGNRSEWRYHETSASVRAFTRVDFDLEATARGQPAPGDTITIDVAARTTFGMPLETGTVNGQFRVIKMARLYPPSSILTEESWSPEWEGRDRRPAAVRDSDSRSREEHRSLYSTIVNGRTTLRLPTADLPDLDTRYESACEVVGVAVDLVVSDGTGHWRETSLTIPLFTEPMWTFARWPEDSTRVLVWRLDNAHRPAPGPVEYRWLRIEPNLAEDRYVETVIDSGSVHVGIRGLASIPVVRGPESTQTVLETSPGDREGRWTRNEKPRRYHRQTPLRADRPIYAIGDTARITVPLEYRAKPTRLVIGPWKAPIEVRLLPAGPDSIIALPITPESIPWLDVLLQPLGRWIGAHAGGHWKYRRSEKLGTRLPVELDSRLLAVQVSTDSKAYDAGDSVAVRLRVFDHLGNPVEALVNISAVDEAVFSVREDRLDFPRHMLLNGAASESQVVACTVGRTSSPAIPPPPRLVLRPTAFWVPGAVTDARTGEAVVKALLPDDLARWRITARAVDLDGRLGEATHQIETTRPLQIRARLPRILRLGDHVAFSTHIDNTANHADRFEVSWSSDLLRGSDVHAASLELAPRTKSTIWFEAEAETVGADTVVIIAQSISATDVRDELRLPMSVLPLEDRQRAAISTHAPTYDLRDVLAALDDRTHHCTGACRRRDHADDTLLGITLLYRVAWKLAASAGLDVVDLEIDACPIDPTAKLDAALARRARFDSRREPLELDSHASSAMRLAALNMHASRGGWWDDHEKKRRRIADRLERLFQSPLLVPEERVQIVHALREMGCGRPELVRPLWEERGRLGPGGRALLAELFHEHDPERALALVRSAAGYARVDADSAYAHLDRWSFEHPEWTVKFSFAMASLLRAIALIEPDHPLGQALVNNSVLEGFARGWTINHETEAMLGALIAWIEAGDTRSRALALNRPRPGGGELFFNRRERIGGIGEVRPYLRRRDVGSAPTWNPEHAAGSRPSAQHPTPASSTPSRIDTVTCAIGDTLTTTLKLGAVCYLGPVSLEIPYAAGCLPLSSGWRWNVQDDRTVLQITHGTPGYTEIRQQYLVIRPGLFHVPGAHARAPKLSGLGARSAPFVVRVRPAGD